MLLLGDDKILVSQEKEDGYRTRLSQLKKNIKNKAQQSPGTNTERISRMLMQSTGLDGSSVDRVTATIIIVGRKKIY